MFDNLKSDIVEHAPLYLSKALTTIGLLGITAAEAIDLSLRIIAAAVAAFVAVWTIRRMSADIVYRKQETKEKIVDTAMKEEQLKQYIIENEIRAKELQQLIESTKQNKNGEIS